MLSHRVPRSTETNAWARLLEERKSSGGRLLDLTEANPTRVGLHPAGPGELEAFAASGPYLPDPRGGQAARAAVADYYRGRGVEVPADDIVLTSGTSEAYAHLFRLLCDPGDEVVSPCPSYPLFEPLATLESVGLRNYRLEWDGRWRLDPDSLGKAIGPRTRAIIVVQPNHPTGSCLSLEEREIVEDLC